MKSRPVGVENILATDQNTRRDDARGGSFLLAHQQLGALALSTTPTNGQTVTVVVNGTSVVFTAVTGSPTNPGDVKAPGTALGFVTNLIAAVRRPDLTTSTFIALSVPNQPLIEYVGWAWPGASTTIVPFSLNKNVNGAPSSLTSLNITTTVTSGTWTAQTMKLYVEDGAYYVNGSRLLFTGASTPTVTAPVSNPRIDVLTIDGSGALAWTTGTENASPVAPTYPANKIPICELYNVVSETALYDTENQQAGQGYMLNDVRPTLNYGANFGAFASDIIPDTTNARNFGSASKQWLTIYGQSVYSNGVLVAGAKFGGTGADGALSISSGTTTIDCANANIVTKNYTSISITGTGKLAFINPHPNGTNIILKSQGNVTITSSTVPCIELGSMGTVGGSAGSSSGTNNANGGQGAGGASAVTSGTAGSAGNLGTTGGSTNPSYGLNIFIAGSPGGSNSIATGAQAPSPGGLTIRSKSIAIAPGTGGAGSGGSNQSGTGEVGHIGGAGAGALYIECAGSLNFTGTINANGVAGGANVGGVAHETAGSGGGAGVIIILYNLLTANSGTINTNGGAAGTGGSGVAGIAGANGASLVVANDEFS